MYSANTWKQEMNQLQDVRFNWDDRLGVTNGHFQLTKGPSEKVDGKLWIAEPLTVAKQLETLITEVARKQLEHLKANPENYEEIADFKREFQCLKNLISDLQGYLKPHEEWLKEISGELYNEIVEFKNGLVKPPAKDRPTKKIAYNERTCLTKVSKRASCDEIVNAATSAFRLSESNADGLPEPIIQSLFCCLMATSALKMILWNPLEWICCGKVTTSTPVHYIINEFVETNRHIQAYQKLANELLHQETEEAALAFRKLAPFVATVDLRLNKMDIYSLGIVLGAATASKICNKIHISHELLKSPDVVAHLYKHAFTQSNQAESYSTYTRKPYGT